MGNRAYLVGSNDPGTPGIVENRLNYNPDTEILAGAGVIPILWCSLFQESDIAIHSVGDVSYSTLVARRTDALALWISRVDRIRSAFPENHSAIASWMSLIETLPFAYVKVDPLEIWMLGELGDAEETQLPSALRWFDSGAETDMRSLLAMAEITYDRQQRRLVSPYGESDPVSAYLHGYKWVRKVPWKDE